MNKILNKINIKKVIIYFMLFQPLIDLITALTTRFNPGAISINIIVKGLFLCFVVLYTFFKYKFKDRKIWTIFLILFILYEFIFLGVNYYAKGSLSICIKDLMGSIKILYFPLLLISLFEIFNKEKIVIESRYFVYVILEYTFLLVFPHITGSAILTYCNGHECPLRGTMGWFYAGNDIGNMLTIIYPLILSYYVKYKSSLFKVILLLLSAYFILNIGTKTVLIGVLGSAIALTIFMFFNRIVNKKDTEYKSNRSFVLLIFIIIVLFSILSPAISNTIDNYNIYTSIEEYSSDDVLEHTLFTERFNLKDAGLKRYNNANIARRIFGIGYFAKDGHEYRTVEFDLFDTFIGTGIVGTILIMSCILYVLINVLRVIFKTKFKDLLKLDYEVYVIAIVLTIGISFTAGHTFTKPACSFFIALIYVNFYRNLYLINNLEKKKELKKVTMMALHLKPGGIEKFITETASFLSNSYEVEIVCNYRYPVSEIIKVDDRVKVKYLLNENFVPNKDKLKKCIKDKNIIGIIKNVYYAFDLLLQKKLTMINYIKNSDSDIYISTRKEHNYILSEYVDNSNIKIATEHDFYEAINSKKEANSCFNIDYFVVSTELQKKHYDNLFDGRIKVVVIPFGINNDFKDQSKLDNYNLITVGRLSKEKGYIDLIDMFFELHKVNDKFKLNIIGYGDQEKELQEKINNLDLNDSVKLLGRKNSEEIKKELLNSSLYLMTSYFESFGIVLIESLSCGVPCIIFDSAKGALEVIKNDYNGYIIKDRNHREYINKILDIFNNKNKLKELGNNSKECSLKYNIKNIENEWLQLINK